MADKKELEQLVNEAKNIYAELARRRLSYFVTYVMPEYEILEHIHKPIIELLERILNGEVKKAIINMPPRCGKSELISKLFPAFVLATCPKTKIITASYGEELVGDMSRGAKAIVGNDYFKELFPNWGFGEKKEGLYWETKEGGSYYATSVGSSITGKGFNIGILDDPIKGRTEAESERERNRVWSWYLGDFLTRRQDQNSAIILMQTRRHVDDLTGRILEKESQNREQLTIPAIGEDGSELIRPGKRDKGYYYKLKEELLDYNFASLYQQTPYLDSDGVFKKDYFQYYASAGFDFKKLKRFTFVDPAISQKHSADNSAIVTIGVDTQSNFIYVLDVFAGKFQPNDLIENIFRINREYRPECIGIENNHFQQAIIKQVNNEMLERNDFFVLEEIRSREEKYSKIKSTLEPRYARNNILHPNDNTCDLLESELLAFPNGKHDDTIDALTGAIQLANKRPTIKDSGPKIFAVDYSAYL